MHVTYARAGSGTGGVTVSFYQLAPGTLARLDTVEDGAPLSVVQNEDGEYACAAGVCDDSGNVEPLEDFLGDIVDTHNTVLLERADGIATLTSTQETIGGAASTCFAFRGDQALPAGRMCLTTAGALTQLRGVSPDGDLTATDVSGATATDFALPAPTARPEE